jgi:hypothetical protein
MSGRKDGGKKAMKTHRNRRNEKGFALVAGLLVVFIISLIVVFTLSYVNETQRMTTQKIRREQAFQVAEAGLYLAISWLNDPSNCPDKETQLDWLQDNCSWKEELTGNLTPPATVLSSDYSLTLLDHDTGDNDTYGIIGQVSDNTPAGGGGTGLLGGIVSSAYAAESASTYKGRVWKLRILGPTTPLIPTPVPTPSPDDMHANYLMKYPVLRLRSEGRADDNRTNAIVEADISLLKYGGLIVPVALVAGANITNNGQFNLHWGQAWAKTDMFLPKPGTQVVKWTQDTLTKYTDDNGVTKNDTWIALKTVGYIRDQNGSYWDGSGWDSTIPETRIPPVTSPQVMFPSEALPLYQRWDRTPFSAGRVAVDPADWILADKITELLNSFDYDRFKEIAMERGQYYKPDSSGKLYNAAGVKVYDSIDQITFYKGGTFDDSKVKADIVFIDTENGLDPDAGGIMHTFVLSGGGSGFYTKGLLYICGSLDVRGMNKPSPLPIVMKDPYQYENGLSATLSRYLWHQGVVFLSGNMYGLRGTSTMYGSIIIKGRYLGEGTPDVYYMPQLKNGEAFPFSSKAVILNWRLKTKWFDWN